MNDEHISGGELDPPPCRLEMFWNDVETPESRDDADEIVGRAFRWSLSGIAVISLLGFFGWLLFAPVRLDHEPAPVTPLSWELGTTHLAADEFPSVTFTDVTQQAGIDFVHFNGATGKLMMPENIGGGCAFFDFERDGDQDILLINGSYFPGHEAPKPRPTMALYDNDGHGRFRNVTAGSGLDVSFYGMGVAVADYDGDGLTDVFVTGLGGNHLFRNLGRGKFAEATASAGVAGSGGWSSSAGFLDYDNDGKLDLFVCNYVDWSEALDDKLDHFRMGVRDYLPPWFFRGTQNTLYRNNGNGTLTDVSRAAGILASNSSSGVPRGKGLGVVFCDLDEDGWTDIVVANDTVPTFLYHNQRDGTFKEIAQAAGVANGHDGLALSGMGIDVGNVHEDRRTTTAVATIAGQPTGMFLSQANPLQFVDVVLSTGIAAESQLYTRWGTFFFDYDLDGRLDLFQCNGSIYCEACGRLLNEEYRQPSQLFWNCGPGKPVRLAPLPAEKRIPALERKLMARGAAFADIDGDGDLDVLITQNGAAPVLLRNDQQLGHHWIRLHLEGNGANREAIGARIEVRVAGQWLIRRVCPTRSFLSQVELPVTIGLGKNVRPDEVRIFWPDGSEQLVADVQVDRPTHVKKKGSSPALGEWVSPK